MLNILYEQDISVTTPPAPSPNGIEPKVASYVEEGRSSSEMLAGDGERVLGEG